MLFQSHPKPEHHEHPVNRAGYEPRHEAPVPANTSIDWFRDARPYAAGTLDVLTSPLSLLIIAGLVENPAPTTNDPRWAFLADREQMPVFRAATDAVKEQTQPTTGKPRSWAPLYRTVTA